MTRPFFENLSITDSTEILKRTTKTTPVYTCQRRI